MESLQFSRKFCGHESYQIGKPAQGRYEKYNNYSDRHEGEDEIVSLLGADDRFPEIGAGKNYKCGDHHKIEYSLREKNAEGHGHRYFLVSFREVSPVNIAYPRRQDHVGEHGQEIVMSQGAIIDVDSDRLHLQSPPQAPERNRNVVE